jgi:hypothetical protein
MNEIIVTDASLAELRRVVIRQLEDCWMPGFVEYQVEPDNGSGDVRIILTQRELGEFGRLELRSLPTGSTEIHLSDTYPPVRDQERRARQQKHFRDVIDYIFGWETIEVGLDELMAEP